MGTERLRRFHHVRAGRIPLAGDLEVTRGTMHRDAVLDQRVQELDRRWEIGLVGGEDVSSGISVFGFAQHRKVFVGHATGPSKGLWLFLLFSSLLVGNGLVDLINQLWVNRPAILAAALDRVLSHQVPVVQHRFPVSRGEVHHGVVGGDRVVHGLPEVPLLRFDGERLITVRQLPVWQERDAHRCRVADSFGQDADLVVEITRRPDVAVEPCRVTRTRTHRRTGLALGDEPAVNCRADRFNAQRYKGVIHVVERIAERRREHHCAGRARLVMVVHHLRIPVAIHDARHVLGLRLRHHVRVAIVVVSDVLLV